MADPPDSIDPPAGNQLAGFDLATRDGAIVGRGVAFDSATLRWNDNARPFDEVAAMDLESLMGEAISIAQCDIVFHDGARLNVRIDSGQEHDIMTFRDFVPGLIERPGPERRSRIMFRPLSPPRPIARIIYIAIASIALIAFAVAGLWALLSDPAARQAEWAAIPLFLLLARMFAAIVRAAFITNCKQFDPASLPARAMPPEPLKVTLARLREERMEKAAGR